MDCVLMGQSCRNNDTGGSHFEAINVHSDAKIAGLVVAYSLVVLTSLFGNSLVCHVIIKNRRLHTVTYVFIMNLSLADLCITVLNIPLTVVKIVTDRWVFGDVECKIVNFVLCLSIYVSTFTLAGIAADRYQVIENPLRPRLTILSGIIIVVFIWIVAMAMSIPLVLYSQVETVDMLLGEVQRCRLRYPPPADLYEKYITLATILTQYCLPLIFIGFTYGHLVKFLWTRELIGNATNAQQVRHLRIKKKTIKMLIIVVCFFALCWMPLNLYHLLTDFHPDNESFRYNSTVYLICHWIAMSSVCYNPFIYCWQNEYFRSQFRDRLSYCRRRRTKIYPGMELDGMLIRADKAKLSHQSRRQSSTVTKSVSTRS